MYQYNSFLNANVVLSKNLSDVVFLNLSERGIFDTRDDKSFIVGDITKSKIAWKDTFLSKRDPTIVF